MILGLKSRRKGYSPAKRHASGSRTKRGLKNTALFHKMVAIDLKWSIESNQQGRVSIKNYNAGPAAPERAGFCEKGEVKA
jgi:hypothetical protein